jgi:hypothetical protein
MAERIEWRVSRDDSFYTLPATMVFLIVFIMLVITHLQVQRRFKVQSGIEAWVFGYAGPDYTGPYLEDHIGNKDQYLQWLDLSGLPMVLGACHNAQAGMPACPVAPQSLLVGDIKLIQTLNDGTDKHDWLLNSPEALAHLGLAGNELDFVGAARKRLNVLWPDWLHGEINKLQLVFFTYSESEAVFARTSAFADIDGYGQITLDCATRAVMVNPYSDWFLWVMDGIYCSFMLWSLWSEIQQYWARGCVGYWDHCGMEGFWNGVDAIGVLMGTANIIQWCIFIEIITAPRYKTTCAQVLKISKP